MSARAVRGLVPLSMAALLVLGVNGSVLAHGPEGHGSPAPEVSAAPAASVEPEVSCALQPGHAHADDPSPAPGESPTPGEAHEDPCGPEALAELGLAQAAGIILAIDSPALGQVNGFELLTTEGERLAFDTSELPFDLDFPVAHLAEHQMLTSPILVTYRTDGDRLIVVALADAE